MKELNTSTKNFSRKKEKNEDLSKNHSKSIRFRIRVQKDKEAKDEIKEYIDDTFRTE